MRNFLIKKLLCVFCALHFFNLGQAYAFDNNKHGFAFFDHVYSINLPQSVARKAHVVSEFKRLGIQNYEIFPAIDKDSPAVSYIMQTAFVKKYPPCFRCGKKKCNCENNVLIKPQIGNWLSFIAIFKDIVKNNYEFVLITEDDVKFTDEAPQIFDELISYTNFAAYGINLNKPLLIRFEQRGDLPAQKQGAHFTKDIVWSNACFMVNKAYAVSFLQHLKQIDHTSDSFIHCTLLKADRSIQHFTAYLQPAYQLSDNVNGLFYSEIHPKGIDEYDKIRKKQHKQRITYYEYLLSKLGF